jgi:hypothetical protein
MYTCWDSLSDIYPVVLTNLGVAEVEMEVMVKVHISQFKRILGDISPLKRIRSIIGCSKREKLWMPLKVCVIQRGTCHYASKIDGGEISQH